MGKYLSPSERALIAEWFWQFFLNHYATSDDFAQEAITFLKQKEYTQALYYFKKANTPDTLSLAASLCIDGSIRLENGECDYLQAEQLCLASKTKDAFYNLGWMYHMKKIGVNEYTKAAKYYEAAGTPDALCNLGNLHREGSVGSINGKPNYEKARQLYLQSQHPNALWNLGRLYRDGKLGEPDNLQAEKYFLEANSQESLTDLGS